MMNEETEMSEELMGHPIDAIVSRIDDYIKNPKLVTKETLTELRNEVEDLKAMTDEEEMPTEEKESESSHKGKGADKGLSIIIGMGSKNKNSKEEY